MRYVWYLIGVASIIFYIVGSIRNDAPLWIILPFVLIQIVVLIRVLKE